MKKIVIFIIVIVIALLVIRYMIGQGAFIPKDDNSTRVFTNRAEWNEVAGLHRDLATALEFLLKDDKNAPREKVEEKFNSILEYPQYEKSDWVLGEKITTVDGYVSYEINYVGNVKCNAEAIPDWYKGN